ncbi:hypothetical protein [Curtobacterium sp. MCBD17_040]|uniref:hypothetical protein n=1 Tax=Curtobacterium sp. MCBD17_040 TaxID=2175674 RepID=UPI000DA8FC14|nr:hypothetical protein [Curtobacterium sp. MCBD17_040]WIB65886.1 hypothetical protein DEI94_17375 [Curtobacterium sp. MCBD17_040]
MEDDGVERFRSEFETEAGRTRLGLSVPPYTAAAALHDDQRLRGYLNFWAANQRAAATDEKRASERQQERQLWEQRMRALRWGTLILVLGLGLFVAAFLALINHTTCHAQHDVCSAQSVPNIDIAWFGLLTLTVAGAVAVVTGVRLAARHPGFRL